MEIATAIKLIEKHIAGHQDVIVNYETAKRYFKKQNDIMLQDKKEKNEERSIRNADNRIPSNFYKLLVNQESSYLYTAPPIFDVEDKKTNEIIQNALGDAFAKKCKQACKESQNGGVAWIHYWRGENDVFKYAVINCTQVIPVWSSDLEEELYAVIRTYNTIEEESGDEYAVYEIWTDKECSSFKRKTDEKIQKLQEYRQFELIDLNMNTEENTNIFLHEWEKVPFIPLFNNDEHTDNLKDIKELIDTYDKVFSGFVNDLEDIQEVILILTNYGGEESSIGEFWSALKEKKVIKVDSDGPDDKSGVSTLAIEIPVEAREKTLAITRKAIFEQGMGIDPDPQNFGNSSGVALTYLYSLLELKAGLHETEARMSFSELVRAICKFNKKSCEKIIQTWTRTSVSNDAELAEIAQKSKGVISDETIVENHPWVQDPTKEMKRLKAQREAEMPNWDQVPIVKDDGDGKEE